MARLAYPYLQQLDQDHKRGRENYLQENYDHYGYFPSFTESNVLTMVRNTFIEGMNKRVRLPNAIVILLSEQILVEDPLYLSSEFERKIKWVIRELDVNIKIRKGSLPSKAYVMGQPRIMWVQAFRTCKGSKIHPDQLLKFNNLLRRTCMSKAIYTIPVDDSSLQCLDFDGKTQIHEGFKFLWHEIINGIKFHDERDKSYEINNLVEERLKEVDLRKQASKERQQHTLGSLQRIAPGAFNNGAERHPHQECSVSANRLSSRSHYPTNSHSRAREDYRNDDRRKVENRSDRRHHQDRHHNHRRY